jgi:predicted DNA-binding protein
MKQIKKTTSMCLDPDVEARLRVAAENEGRSLSNLVNRLLKACLPPMTDAEKAT